MIKTCEPFELLKELNVHKPLENSRTSAQQNSKTLFRGTGEILLIETTHCCLVWHSDMLC